MLSRLSIAVRINLLLALTAFGMLDCAGIGLWALRGHMLEDRRAQLGNLMDLALNDARGHMNRSGGAKTKSGQSAFLELIKGAKFGDSAANYFFVYDYDGVAVLHPDPSRQGQNRSDAVYSNGVKMAPKFIEAGNAAPLGGFLEYDGPDGVGKLTPKLSHFRDVPELHVVVGVGADIKDINAAFLGRLQLMALLFAFVMLAIVLAGFTITHSIGGPLSNAIRKITRLANGDLDIAPANVDEKSELGAMERALDVLRANAVEQRALQEIICEQNKLLIQQQKESEERWRQFVDQAPVAMLMLDRNMVHLASSCRWIELIGHEEAGIGRFHYDVFTELPAHWKEAHRRALSGETVRAEEEVFVRLDGSKIWVRWEMRPWLTSEGDIGGITIMSQDVTDRVLAVQALRENELRMRLAQEAAKAGTWESRPADKTNEWSDTLWKLFGLEPQQCKPTLHLWLSTIHPEDRELVQAEVGKAAASGETFEIQWRANRPEGEPERWFFARGRPLSDEKPDNYFGVVIDITEQKLMEQALRESEMRMRLAQEAARAGAWEWRLEDKRIHWSDSLWNLYGVRKPEQWEPTLEAWMSLVHPADRERIKTEVWEAVTHGQDLEVQWRLKLPKGEPERWFLSRGRPIADGTGKLDRYFGVIIDITEQKLMEEALRESKKRQSFLLSLNDALRVIGNPNDAMAIASKMLGQKIGAAQVVYADIIQPGQQVIIRRDWNDGTIGQQSAVYKLEDFGVDLIRDLKSAQTLIVADMRLDPRTLTPASQAIFERNSVAAFIYVPLVKDGRLGAVLGVHRRTPHEWRKEEIELAQEVAERTWQVVERARVSHALRESEGRLKFALSAGEVGTWELSLNTGEFATSEEALAFLDMPRGKKVTLKSVLARVYPDDRRLLQEALLHALETGETYALEWRTQLADGSIRWLETRGERRSVFGKHVVSGLIQDITKKVKQREVAERAAKAESEFLSNMSHELRTPMHAILGYTGICVTAFKEGKTEGIEKYLNNITASGRRLLNLLNDLLNLAKMEEGKMEYKLERGDLKDVVEHTLMELDPLIREKNVQMRVKLEDCTDAVFSRNHLIQVLINLVSNAVKFSNPGSQIAINLSEDRLSSGERAVRCGVVDEGPGIPEDELRAVFDKFVQSKKTKTGKGGTGLGLAICDHIIKAHGGQIWAENAQPRGAAFTFVIPGGDAQERVFHVANTRM